MKKRRRDFKENALKELFEIEVHELGFTAHATIRSSEREINKERIESALVNPNLIYPVTELPSNTRWVFKNSKISIVICVKNKSIITVMKNKNKKKERKRDSVESKINSRKSKDNISKRIKERKRFLEDDEY